MKSIIDELIENKASGNKKEVKTISVTVRVPEDINNVVLKLCKTLGIRRQEAYLRLVKESLSQIEDYLT